VTLQLQVQFQIRAFPHSAVQLLSLLVKWQYWRS